MRQIGTTWPSRRAFIGGGLSLSAFSGEAFAQENVVWRLTADPIPGGLTSYGYNGESPGPLIRAQIGRPCRIRLANKLGKPTSLALVGLRLPFAPTVIAPGETAEIAFTPEEPGFGLYLPYGPNSAADQLGGGLFGAIIVQPPDGAPVDLEALAIFSVSDLKGELRANAGLAPLEWTAPAGARVRLRLANAAPTLALLLKASAPIVILAVDGQPCEMFAPRAGEFPLAPSARIELGFDMPEGGVDFVANDQPALHFRPKGERAATRPPIAALPSNPRLPVAIALERAKQVRIVASGTADKGFSLNGDPAKPLFKAARGSPVSLTLVNQTADMQTLRLEGQVARVLHSFDDGWDPYWRDVLVIGPGKTLHAAFIADRAGKWPLASASPERRAKGLAGWFQVT